jgi:hypothetical protein
MSVASVGTAAIALGLAGARTDAIKETA